MKLTDIFFKNKKEEPKSLRQELNLDTQQILAFLKLENKELKTISIENKNELKDHFTRNFWRIENEKIIN